MHILSLLILAAWVMALGRTILNLIVVPRLRAGGVPSSTGPLPLVSVIIPARDEERAIERTVRAFEAQSWPAIEIIVVNDRSTDATGSILAALARNDSRLIVIDNEEPPPGWLGKPWALHQGSLRARGELLLFADADIVYEPEAISAAVLQFQKSGTSMIALLPRFVMRGFWEHITMPNLAFFVFTVLPLWLSNRSRSNILALGAGTGNLIAREVYDAIGGHVALRDAVIDDVALSRLVRRSGRYTQAVMADRLVSVRMYEGLGEVVRGFTKNGFSALGRSYGAVTVLMLLGFVFHILPFGLALAGDVTSMMTVAVISLTRLILFAALRYRLDNALFGHPLMMGVWLAIMLRSVWYTGIRRQLLWRGRTYDARRTKFGAGE